MYVFELDSCAKKMLMLLSGEVIADENEEGEEKGESCTKYKLVGVVVHSGQASGGHYYSYILHRTDENHLNPRWYKFDDGEVMECKMDDDEEMKNQCFGGEYVGEVFDHMLKRLVQGFGHFTVVRIPIENYFQFIDSVCLTHLALIVYFIGCWVSLFVDYSYSVNVGIGFILL